MLVGEGLMENIVGGVNRPDLCQNFVTPLRIRPPSRYIDLANPTSGIPDIQTDATAAAVLGLCVMMP